MHAGRRYWSRVVPLLVLIPVLVFAQHYELLLDGNYGDLQLLPPQDRQNHDFTFVRLIYNGRIRGYLKNWYTDYPTGDRNLVRILRRMTGIDIAPDTRAIPIHHPDLFQYPMIYSAEAGQMVLDQSDARALRDYLTRGGFWMIDDFWGSIEWSHFEHEMRKIFPTRQIVELPLSHPFFTAFYEIERKMQVPNIGFAYNPGTPTWEQDGYKPYVRGVLDDGGRLMVLIHFNTDLMDASEWADDALYPGRYSAYSYKVFCNAVVYAMSH